ncbi:MAG: tetratricopeptide repeat protein [Anaerolineales bacterium]
MSEAMYAEAMQAAKAGQRRRARDLFTRLLKAESTNADYWLWLSALVDTEREQIACLQRALKAAPNSLAARRGLVMLGALKPEDAALPPAPTLDKFVPAQPVRTVARAALRNRDWILIGLSLLLAVCAVGAVVTFILRPETFLPVAVIVPTRVELPTLTPEPTETPTPSATPISCDPPTQVNPATPLAAYLCEPPATPRLYIPTEAVNRPEEAYQTVRNAYRRREWSRVIQFAPQAIEAYVADPYPYFYLAEAQRNTGNFTEATKNYRQAIGNDATFAPAYYGRALLNFQQGRADTGIRDLDAALQASADFVPPYVARAEYYTANGNVARALDDLEQARSRVTGDADVLARLALAYADNDRPQDAATTADAALALDKTSVIAYYARGRARLALGLVEDGNSDLSLAYRYITEPATFAQLFPIAATLKADDRYAAAALYYFGAAQTALGQEEAALAAYNEAIARDKTAPLPRVARGQSLLQTQAYSEAQADFGVAIVALAKTDETSPQLGVAYLGNGLALLGLNRPDNAVSNFQAALRTLPTSFEANAGLGQALTRTNKAKDALTPLNAAFVLAQTNAQRAEVLWWRARAYALLGQRAEERADLEALTALGDDSPLLPTAQARLTQLQIEAAGTATPTIKASATKAVTATRTATPTRTRTAGPPTPSPTLNLTKYPAPVVSTPTPTRPGTGYPPPTPRP